MHTSRKSACFGAELVGTPLTVPCGSLFNTSGLYQGFDRIAPVKFISQEASRRGADRGAREHFFMLQNCASECVNNRKYRTLQDACDEGAPCALEVADTCSCYNFLCVDVPSDKIFLRKRACMHPSFNEHGAVIGRRQTQRHAECGPGRRGAPPPSRPAGRRERARRRRGWAATPADDGGHPARGWERPAPGPAGTRRWGVS